MKTKIIKMLSSEKPFAHRAFFVQKLSNYFFEKEILLLVQQDEDQGKRELCADYAICTNEIMYKCIIV